MGIIRFPLENYQISLGDGLTSTWGDQTIRARGVIGCYGTDYRLILYFLTEDSPVPKPLFIERACLGAIFLPFRDYPAYIDLLRNEKPVYGSIDTEDPTQHHISTLHEPIGEEES
ncbi:MAG: hypothetical protein ACE5JR_05715 [Gemmatimonadota bacterium]